MGLLSSLLTNPVFLYSLITLATGGMTTLGIKSCSQSNEVTYLKEELLKTQQDLTRCQANLATIQSEMTRQATELDKYNHLASRYRKELEVKYQTPDPTPTPCTFDFSIANSILKKQGRQ